MVEARIARALNLLREDSDLLAADQEHLLELMDEFFDDDDLPPVIPTNHYTYIIYYSHYDNS